MFVATRVEFDWNTGRVLSRRGYSYIGPVARAKGASPAEKALADSQTKFYTTLSASYATQFANQNAILASLKTSLQPVIDAGINAYGYNPAQDTALRTQASRSEERRVGKE